ncbi:hypothetical protein ABPG77_003234 [Micractinium sp. CCAP 211/92]
MVDLGSEAGVLKLSSTVAGAVAAMSLLAPDKFQDTFYDASVPHAHVSVTRHHAIVLAGLSALMATAASPRADRPLQRTALKVAGATWLAAGLLNVYETTNSQMTKATWGIAAVNCLLGGLCLWKATRASKGSARP